MAVLLAAGTAYGLHFWTGRPDLVWVNVLRPLLGTLYLSAYFWGWGASLSRLGSFRPAEGRLQPLPTFALGVCAAVPVILFMGMIGLLHLAVFLPLSAAIAVLGMWLRPPWREPWLNPTTWTPLEAVLAAALAAWAVAASVLALVPDLSWDALFYHLAVGKIYLQHGRILDIPWLFPSNFPMNGGLVFLHGLLLDDDRVAIGLDLVLLLLAAASAYFLGRLFLSRALSLFATLAFALSQHVLIVICTCMVDLCLTAFATLSLACALRWRKGTMGLDAWLHLSAIFAGFAAGTKISGLASGAAVGAIVLLSRGAASRPFFAPTVRFAWISLLSASPCYLKSWIHTGTPVWPLSLGVFQVRHWHAELYDSLVRALQEYWAPLAGQSLSSIPASVVSMAGDRSSLLLGFSLLFLAGTVLRRSLLGELWPLVLFVLANLLFWCLVTQQDRFLVPALPAILTGLVCLTRPEPGRALPRLAFTTGWLVLLMTSCPVWALCTRSLLRKGFPLLLGTRSREEVLAENSTYRVCKRTNELTAPDSRVLLYQESRGYWLDREYMRGDWASQVVVDYGSLHSTEDLRARLRDLGITHVLVREHIVRPGEAYNFHSEALVRDLLVQCQRIEIEASHALYDLNRPASDAGPTLVASSTDSSRYSVEGILGAGTSPGAPHPGAGWMSSAIPSPSNPEEILILYSRARSMHHLRLESDPDPHPSLTDFAFQQDQRGTWVEIPGASVAGSSGATQWTFSFEPVETRRLRLMITGAAGGRARVHRIEVE